MTENEVIGAKCVSDTMFAMCHFFFKQNGRKFTVGSHHRVIAKLLDDVFAGKYNRVIINMPPRYTKTEFIKTFLMKGLAINPESKYIMLSYSATLAIDNSKCVKDVVSSDWYQELYPWVKVRQDSRAKNKWETTRGGGIYATSSNGQVTGFGAGLVRDVTDDDMPKSVHGKWGGAIIIDDPLKPLDASSPVNRKKVNEQFENTIRSRVNDKNTPIIIIMQRLHKEDLSGYLMANEPDEWKVLSMPALSVDDDGDEVALWPFRHTVDDLHKLRAVNRFTFETQYQQNPMAINEKLWLFAFDRSRHVGKTEYNKDEPLIMSWDFNRNPMTCSLFQHASGQIRCIDCIRIENATTKMVCQEIEKRYGGAFFLVTGDVAGRSMTTVSQMNNYDVIKQFFNLSRGQMQYRTQNPRLADSRYFVNSIFEQYDILFDEERCKPAIFDFENVLSDDENRPIKSSRENVAQQADFLDNVRYYLHIFYKEFKL